METLKQFGEAVIKAAESREASYNHEHRPGMPMGYYAKSTWEADKEALGVGDDDIHASFIGGLLHVCWNDVLDYAAVVAQKKSEAADVD